MGSNKCSEEKLKQEPGTGSWRFGGLCVGCLILNRNQGRLIVKVTFMQRPERSKGVSHVEIWEGIPASAKTCGGVLGVA